MGHISRDEVPENSRWIPLEDSYISKRERYILCQCLCGTEKYVNKKTLLRGSSLSCGCFRKEWNSESKKGKSFPKYSDGLGPARQTYRKLVRQAEQREYSVSLTYDQYIVLALSNCHYCDTSPSNVAKHTNGINSIKVSGIDRVDNSLGYHENNCVACCYPCNRAKSTMGYNEFISWIGKVYAHHQRRDLTK